MPKTTLISYFIIILQTEMTLTAFGIAKEIGGSINPNSIDCKITAAAKLEEGKSNALGFFSNPKYEKSLYETQCGAVIVPAGFIASKSLNAILIEHANPYFAFCAILSKHFDPNKHRTGIEEAHIHATAILGKNLHIAQTAYIEEEASVGDNTVIYPGVYIGRNVKIGANCILYPNVVIYSDCIVGNHCIIQAGSVVGGDGFGFAPMNGKYVKIPQIGNVVLEDWVELGSNCSIDRATMGVTIIRTGSKLDNLVQIAHNVDIGEHTVIAAQTGIAGSTKVGNHSQFGGQAGVAGHISIAPYTSVGGQAGITGNISEPNQKLTGTPATDVRTFLKSIASSRKIPALIEEVDKLKKEIANLKNNNK